MNTVQVSDNVKVVVLNNPDTTEVEYVVYTKEEDVETLEYKKGTQYYNRSDHRCHKVFIESNDGKLYKTMVTYNAEGEAVREFSYLIQSNGK